PADPFSLTPQAHPEGRRSAVDPPLPSTAMRNLIGIVVIVWLVIGVFAAFQRGYLTDKKDVHCRTVGDTAVTIVAGPLNCLRGNPKVDCNVNVPNPSKYPPPGPTVRS